MQPTTLTPVQIGALGGQQITPRQLQALGLASPGSSTGGASPQVIFIAPQQLNSTLRNAITNPSTAQVDSGVLLLNC